MLKLFVAARSRHKAVCGPQGFMRSQENGWSCFSGDVGRHNGPVSWFYVDPQPKSDQPEPARWVPFKR